MTDNDEKNISIEAVEITSIDYSKYGILYNLSGSGINTANTNHSSGTGWEDTDTNRPLLDTLGALGYTHGQGAPFYAKEMERHAHTQEALFPISQPIVFCLAEKGKDVPEANSIVPVILRQGYVFVLHRSIWHTSSYGLNGETHYHWMALVYYNEPTEWKTIDGGPVYITIHSDNIV